MNYKKKQEKIQRVKIRLNLKTNDISLTVSSNLLYFNFTKSRSNALETMFQIYVEIREIFRQQLTR